jgi:hypothetical protein
MKLSPRMIALALPVLWSCAIDDGVSPVNTAAPRFYLAQNLPLVYDVENTGANFATTVPSFAQSPSNLILPDPFRSFNGSVDLTFAGWEHRRAEVLASIEQYEIGPKPDPSDVDITASMAHGLPGYDTLIVVVTRKSNGQSLTLRSRVNLPAGSGPFPAIIGMNSPSGSVPSDIFTSRNIARITYRHNDVTRYFGKSPTNPYFILYPEYGAAGVVGQYSAWAWGVSRLIDGIALAARQGDLPIDVSHLGVTGCSYAGKMALFAGALDERVALTIAQESGGGGMPSWRPSWVLRDPRGDVERIGNTDGSWFITGMKTQFAGDNVFKLPHDHHQLMALVAPRGLLATNNYDYIWLSNPSAYISAKAAQETYRQLGIVDRFGYIVDGSLTGNSHGHCQVPASQRPALEAFVDRFLLGLNVNTDIAAAQVSPYTDAVVDSRGWLPWSLRSDIADLVAQGTLTADQGAGLSDKLEAALSSIANGKTNPALNQLNAFANQVNAFVTAGKLTPQQGAVLTDKVNSTKTRLGA